MLELEHLELSQCLVWLGVAEVAQGGLPFELFRDLEAVRLSRLLECRLLFYERLLLIGRALERLDVDVVVVLLLQ